MVDGELDISRCRSKALEEELRILEGVRVDFCAGLGEGVDVEGEAY